MTSKPTGQLPSAPSDTVSAALVELPGGAHTSAGRAASSRSGPCTDVWQPDAASMTTNVTAAFQITGTLGLTIFRSPSGWSGYGVAMWATVLYRYRNFRILIGLPTVSSRGFSPIQCISQLRYVASHAKTQVVRCISPLHGFEAAASSLRHQSGWFMRYRTRCIVCRCSVALSSGRTRAMRGSA